MDTFDEFIGKALLISSDKTVVVTKVPVRQFQEAGLAERPLQGGALEKALRMIADQTPAQRL
jgi:hypothetical protein